MELTDANFDSTIGSFFHIIENDYLFDALKYEEGLEGLFLTV